MHNVIQINGIVSHISQKKLANFYSLQVGGGPGKEKKKQVEVFNMQSHTIAKDSIWFHYLYHPISVYC